MGYPKQPTPEALPCPACGNPLDENMFCMHCAEETGEADEQRQQAEEYEEYRRSQM